MTPQRIAIVERGSAALRMIRAAREYGWERGVPLRTLVLYGAADGDAPAVREADEAIALDDGDGALERALLAARADALWACREALVPSAELATIAARLSLTRIGAAALPELDANALARLAGSAGLSCADPAERGPMFAVDVVADRAGTVWPVGPRQLAVAGEARIEACPPVDLSDVEIDALRRLAAGVATAAAVVGTATIVLRWDSRQRRAALAGVSGRLQPGHVLGELATGLDLVKLQLRVAAGEPLAGPAPLPTATVMGVHLGISESEGGDAHRARLMLVRLPSGPGVRVDCAAREGDVVEGDILTLAAAGGDRGEARARLHRALADTTAVLEHGETDKAVLLAALAGGPGGAADAALLCAAVAMYDDETAVAQAQFDATAARGRPRVPNDVGRVVALRHRGQIYQLRVHRLGPDRYRVDAGGARIHLGVERHGGGEGRLRLGARSHRFLVLRVGRSYVVEIDGTPYRVTNASGRVARAPGPAVVLSVAVQAGDQVAAGAPLLVLESMKTEMPVSSPIAGRVAEVLVHANVQVDTGAALVRFEPADDPRPADAVPVTFVASDAADDAPALRCRRNLAALKDLLLGFDVDPGDTARLLAERQASGADVAAADPALRAAEADLLVVFADLQGLFRPRGPDSLARGEPLGSEEYLIAFLRTRGTTGPSAFRERLRRAVGHYGVRDLTPSPELDAALFRICLAHQRAAAALAVVRSVLEGWLARSAPPVDPALQALLDRLIAVAQGRDQIVCDLARELRYRCFDEPFFAAVRARAYAEAEAHLDALGAPGPDAAAHIAALVDCPQPLVGRIAHHLEGASTAARRALLEVLTRRYYRVRALQDFRSGDLVGGWSVAMAVYPHDDHRIHVIAAAIQESDLPHTAAALQALVGAVPAGDEVAIDLYVATTAATAAAADSTAARLGAELGAAAFARPIGRIVVVLCGPHIGDREGVELFTFRQQDGGIAEDRGLRGVHPIMAERLHLDRLANFRIERLPSVDDVYLYRAVAHANPKDERLFAIAEVRDLTPVRDAGGRIVQRPVLERMLIEALAALRHAQAQRPPRQRLYWNRVLLYVWPPFDLSADEINGIMRRLAPATEGLGLEQVLLLAKRPAPNGSGLRDRVLRMANPDRSGPVMTDEPAPELPLQPMTEYEQKVVRMRQRGLLYPYELIRMLTPAAAGAQGDFPPGSFVEYDLDAEQRLVPVERPHGQNTANLVVGVIRSRTARYPEGMARVMILGDPSRAMGSVAEAECRRIDAALDLAEQLHLPVEWFALCSGATIAMDSGTENMDWCARTIRRIIEFTQAGGEINVVVYGINVGAQSYWNAEATMLMHTRGILIMTGDGSMVLTGKRALDYSGGVSAEDNRGIGGYERIMGPNGQAQYWAADVADACRLLLQHYEHTYVAPGERFPRRAATADPRQRDVTLAEHGRIDDIDFATIGDVLSPALNAGRKKPFDIRRFLSAAIDRDHPPLERWPDMRNAEASVVWDAHLGGYPVCLIGIECRPLPRAGFVPADGPDQWTPGTLFPLSSKKVARAINSASGNRPVVVLANLSGFDGSPESMRSLQLEYGAEIGRAVVNFRGPFVFCVISRYHGGAYVVFSKVLNERIESAALEGSYASVIGGAPAAAVVFTAEVEARTRADARVRALDQAIAAAGEPERGRLRSQRQALWDTVHAEKFGEMADQFDHVHTVQRAQQTGALDHIISAAQLRPFLIEAIERGIRRDSEDAAAAGSR